MTADANKEDFCMAKITKKTEIRRHPWSNPTGCSSQADLSVEESNILPVAYKNTTGLKRTAYRALNLIEMNEEQKTQKSLHLLNGCKSRIEASSTDNTMRLLTWSTVNCFPRPSSLKRWPSTTRWREITKIRFR